jgi:hypothetical protein
LQTLCSRQHCQDRLCLGFGFRWRHWSAWCNAAQTLQHTAQPHRRARRLCICTQNTRFRQNYNSQWGWWCPHLKGRVQHAAAVTAAVFSAAGQNGL